MAVEISVIDNVIRVVLSEIVSNRDLEEIAVRAKDYEQGPIVLPRLTDMSGATGVNLTFESVWALALCRRTLRFPNSFKSAIVAPQPALLGFARMFQTLNDNPQITIQIFSDLPAALAWIAEKR